VRNRIFKHGKPRGQDGGAPYVNVTSIAAECGFPFKTFVSRRLLRAYTLPDFRDDAERRLFVAYLLDEIWAAMLGQLPSASSISYGNSFALFFEFVAQPRQLPMPEILDLCSWFGPWEPETAVHVWIASGPDSGGDAPG
jgi:hypothetical protein